MSRFSSVRAWAKARTVSLIKAVMLNAYGDWLQMYRAADAEHRRSASKSMGSEPSLVVSERPKMDDDEVKAAWDSMTPEQQEMSRRVWAELEADPEFGARMKKSEEDFAAGRTFIFDRTTSPWDAYPAYTWKPDDPVQPTGWHHDGEKWVKDA